MQHILNLLSVIIALNISAFTFAQGEAALPFLYYIPSLESNGLGLTGTSIPNDEAFGFYYNPANLGYFGRDKNLSFQFYSSSPDLISDNLKAGYNSFALNLGYSFRKFCGFDLSVGAGFIHNNFKYKNTFGLFSDDEDTYNAFGLGVMLDYYIAVSLGITLKNINSKLGFAEASANPIDYGILIEVPVIKLINNDISIPVSSSTSLIPLFNYSIGYSRLNIGDEIYYVDPAQADPLPLYSRLGHSFKFAFDFQMRSLNINLFDYCLILEADDLLVSRSFKQNGVTTNYQGLIGDIDFGRHLIQLKGDDKVVVHKGHSIKLGETVTLMYGSYSGRSYRPNIKTDGFEISSRGMTKLLNSIMDNNIISYIANHIELKYINSSVFTGSLLETDFSALSVSFFNFAFN